MAGERHLNYLLTGQSWHLAWLSNFCDEVLEQPTKRLLGSTPSTGRNEAVGGMAEISRLPGPVADIWEWQLQGSCRDTDPTLFFHPEGERGPARRNRDAAAKAICAACPVLTQCRSHALVVREPYGVWGGLTEDDREVIYSSERRRRMPVAS